MPPDDGKSIRVSCSPHSPLVGLIVVVVPLFALRGDLCHDYGSYLTLRFDRLRTEGHIG